MLWIANALLLYAAAIDIKKQNIPNAVCLLLIILGLWKNLSVSFEGVYISLIGLLIGLVPMLILRSFSGIGAGDVKLMAAIGSMVGTPLIWSVFYYSFLLSGLVAFVLIFLKRLLVKQVPQYAKEMDSFVIWGGENTRLKKLIKLEKIPMAPGMAIATFYVLLPDLLKDLENVGVLNYVCK